MNIREKLKNLNVVKAVKAHDERIKQQRLAEDRRRIERQFRVEEHHGKIYILVGDIAVGCYDGEIQTKIVLNTISRMRDVAMRYNAATT